MISKALINTIRTQGLHKVAAAMHDKKEFGLKEAAQLIGEKRYLQRTENKKIAAGINALNALNRGA